MHKKDTILLFALSTVINMPSFGEPCHFDNTKNCSLQRDILNDKSPNGMTYFAPTNYDHRKSGELNVFDSTLVEPYNDDTNAPGQLKLTLNKISNNFYKSGEIMTRKDLHLPPYSSPIRSLPWTTKEIVHGYLEVKVKLPKCDLSDDGLCQRNINPLAYSDGLWPAVWLMPTNDANWPMNGEVDVAEAYATNTYLKISDSILHFNGNDPRCIKNDCKLAGFKLGEQIYPRSNPQNLYNDFHTWGFEWRPDPKSTNQGVIITGYFDDKISFGPIATDSLPADGPNAFRRAFNDPNGGMYLIVETAIGGPYAGPPNPHLISATMYIQSIKAYAVIDNNNVCLPPANIKSIVSDDKKQLIISWQTPTGSAPISFYEIHDYQNRFLYRTNGPNEYCYTDTSLSGNSGIFSYFLYSQCGPTISQLIHIRR